ncbi:glycosyltransferase family 9 protein [Desulfovibrio psychrotolerans]|uniref:Heptosyltransferase n=1 Tax=Desulfovibrio psychrotolerans TaxID=415242 RepID=A0A7J0BPC1_9BACT|nr:glycosyltransferase family 9 protein [Desulfovibrio psychrotolerans]GFM35547.1 heptosyltransferase [Desulfovibrio psychrotolerans]
MAKSLIIQLARFGDVLQTKRLVCSLLQDGGEVHLCVDASLAELARRIFPDAMVHGMRAHGTVAGDMTDAAGNMAHPVHSAEAMILAENRAVFDRLRAERFDAVFNLNFSGLNFALSAMFDPETVHGYRYAAGQHLKDRWMRMAFRWTRNRRTSPLNLMDFWGLLAPNPIRPESVNPIAMRKGGGLGVVLAGRNSRRSLPVDMLARCVQAVFEAHGGPRVTLLGTRAELPLARQLMRHFSGALLNRTEDRVGRTDYGGLVDMVSGLDVLLTPDTGTMHLAAHLGTPVQAFFLSSAWAHETGPYGLGHRVWQAVLQCSPCLESRPCPIGVECLKSFDDPLFHRILAGKIDASYPPGVLGLVSMLDAVGVTYLPVFGEDAAAAARLDQRMLVAEMFGLVEDPVVEDNEAATALLTEADWMLPARG